MFHPYILTIWIGIRLFIKMFSIMYLPSESNLVSVILYSNVLFRRIATPFELEDFQPKIYSKSHPIPIVLVFQPYVFINLAVLEVAWIGQRFLFRNVLPHTCIYIHTPSCVQSLGSNCNHSLPFQQTPLLSILDKYKL